MDGFEATLDTWQPFFTAQLGAGAALLGLLFVGLSLNLAKILTLARLVWRAQIALILLMLVLIVSSLTLIPGQSRTVVGIEIILAGAVSWVLTTAMSVRIIRHTAPEGRSLAVQNLLLLQLATLPYLLGGVLLLVGRPAALYVAAAGLLLSFVKALLDAWVLLVEINR